MVRCIKIAAILFAFIAFGCSKSEEQGPGSEVPNSITDEPFVAPSDVNGDFQELRPADPIYDVQEINDDGDDESGPNDNRVD